MGEEATKVMRAKAKAIKKTEMKIKRIENLGKASLLLVSYIGTTLAIIISWAMNHSVSWAIVHGLVGWFYIAYHMLNN